MPFDSTEQKLDTHNAHTSENKTIDATHQIKHRESREAELRDAFRKADFSERAGTPAERLAIMSKAANDLTRERAEMAAAKQKEEDAGFWESERSKSNDSAPTEKDTTIKPAPIAIEQKKEAAPKQADIKSSDNIDIKSSDKIDIKSDSKPASPKSPKAKELKRTHDDDDDHWSDMPSERRSKLDRRADENIPSDIAAQVEAEHKERVAKEKAEPARQLDWTPAGEEEHLNRQLAERKQWQAKFGREIDDPDNHTNTGARPTLREELAHHSARIWGTVGQSDKEHHIPTATHVPAKLELHSKELDRRALRGDDDAIIEQKRSISTTTAPTLTGKLSEAKSSIGAKLHDAKELVEDKLEAAEDKLAHWKDEAVEKLTHAKDKAVEIKDDAVSKATELRDDASAKATEIKRDAISKKDEISRDIDIKRAEISRDVDSKRKEISRDVDSKRAEIGRDIDSKRAELRGKADSIDRDIRSRSAELKADAKDATSTIRAQAHTISDDVKAEVRDDIAAVKAKMNELGRSITHKKDELKADIQQRDPTHHREIDMSNRRSGVIVEEKPAGLMDKVSSWWSGNKQEQHETTLATGATGTLFPAHRWSRDPDAKDMQAKLEELRAAEGTQRTPMRGHDSTFAGGVRSQLSQGWQHIKTDLKPSGKKDIEEHDWVDQADKASAFDIDNAPSSPRSWASSSPRSPASPIQRSASPVSYRARSASPVAIQQEGGFFSGFDPTVMDACVEPW